MEWCCQRCRRENCKYFRSLPQLHVINCFVEFAQVHRDRLYVDWVCVLGVSIFNVNTVFASAIDKVIINVRILFSCERKLVYMCGVVFVLFFCLRGWIGDGKKNIYLILILKFKDHGISSSSTSFERRHLFASPKPNREQYASYHKWLLLRVGLLEYTLYERPDPYETDWRYISGYL